MEKKQYTIQELKNIYLDITKNCQLSKEEKINYLQSILSEIQHYTCPYSSLDCVEYINLKNKINSLNNEISEFEYYAVPSKEAVVIPLELSQSKEFQQKSLEAHKKFIKMMKKIENNKSGK